MGPDGYRCSHDRPPFRKLHSTCRRSATVDLRFDISRNSRRCSSRSRSSSVRRSPAGCARQPDRHPLLERVHQPRRARERLPEPAHQVLARRPLQHLLQQPLQLDRPPSCGAASPMPGDHSARRQAAHQRRVSAELHRLDAPDLDGLDLRCSCRVGQPWAVSASAPLFGERPSAARHAATAWCSISRAALDRRPGAARPAPSPATRVSSSTAPRPCRPARAGA